MHLRMAWADRSQDCLSRLSSDADFFHLHIMHPALSSPGLGHHGLEDKTSELSTCGNAGLTTEVCEGHFTTMISGPAWHFAFG